VRRTLKLTIAYDGTDFAGWQRQATERTVQAAIEDALAPIEGERVVIVGAGRTDAGVHAARQVASGSLQSNIGLHDLQRALNATLPQDVRILDIQEANATFNAQFAARRKTYHYWIWSAGVMPPHVRRFMWHVPQPLDIDRMNDAARAILGEHDFAAFQAAGSDVRTTVREMAVSQVTRLKPGPSMWCDTPGFGSADQHQPLIYQITGTGFLRHMVRNIVGTLVDIGRGRRTVDEMSVILASRDRAAASATAPPHGLVLWNVEY